MVSVFERGSHRLAVSDVGLTCLMYQPWKY